MNPSGVPPTGDEITISYGILPWLWTLLASAVTGLITWAAFVASTRVQIRGLKETDARQDKEINAIWDDRDNLRNEFLGTVKEFREEARETWKEVRADLRAMSQKR